MISAIDLGDLQPPRSDINFRSWREDDAPAILDIWQQSTTTDPLTHSLLKEKAWEDPDFRSEWTVLAEHRGQVVAMALAVVRKRSHPRGHLKLLAVAPFCRRQKIGSLMLRRMEEQLLAHGCATARLDEAAPNYLNPGVDTDNEIALAFFRHHGYREIGVAVHQRVELAARNWSQAACQVQPVDAKIQIRRAEADDLVPVKEWLGQTWPAWIDEVAQAFRNDPISVHLAFHESAVMGFAAYDANNRGLGWFGPMGTDARFQGHGVGRALLYRCLHDQWQQGYEHAIIPWVGPVDFYQRTCNAVMWRSFRRMEKPLS